MKTLKITVALIFIFQFSIFNCQAQPLWKVSGAPIGDTSVFLYPVGGWTGSNTLTLPYSNSQDSFKVFNATGTPDGIHIYGVNKAPNAICAINTIGGYKPYYGVFIVNGTSPTYDVNYYYAGNPNVTVANEPNLVLYNRPTNADTTCGVAWNLVPGTLNMAANTIVANGYGNLVVFWNENFGTGCNTGQLANGFVSSNGTWSLTNGTNDPFANEWFISSISQIIGGSGNCGLGACGGSDNRSLHIGNAAVPGLGLTADLGATYLTGTFSFFGINSTTDKRIESPTINCTGKSNIVLSFDYIEGGETTIDNLLVWYFDGTNWTQIDDPSKQNSACGGLGTGEFIIATRTLNLPASANNNANVKIAFKWINDNNAVGSDPSCSIDNIQLAAPVGLRNEFVLGINSPLPVTLTYFKANCAANGVLLTWQTASEINNDFFEIQKSTDATNFTTIATKQGNGNSNAIINYSYTDLSATNNTTIYYRLKQVDFDGQFEYSNISPVTCKEEILNWNLYPNPASSVLNFEYYSVETTRLNIQIFNKLGQLVYTTTLTVKQEETTQLQINVAQLVKGVYTFVITTQNGNKDYKKVVVN